MKSTITLPSIVFWNLEYFWCVLTPHGHDKRPEMACVLRVGWLVPRFMACSDFTLIPTCVLNVLSLLKPIRAAVGIVKVMLFEVSLSVPSAVDAWTRIKTVAYPIDCANISRAPGIVLELLPDVDNEIVDGPSCVHLVARKQGEQPLPTDSYASIAEQELQDSEFSHSHRECPTISTHLHSIEIHTNMAERDGSFKVRSQGGLASYESAFL
jgi:hypothetical protein